MDRRALAVHSWRVHRTFGTTIRCVQTRREYRYRRFHPQTVIGSGSARRVRPAAADGRRFALPSVAEGSHAQLRLTAC